MNSKYWRTERAGIVITAVLSEVRRGNKVVGYALGATYKSPKEVDNQEFARAKALERATLAASVQILSNLGMVFAMTSKIGEEVVVTGSYSSVDHVDHVVELLTAGKCPVGFIQHFEETYLPELEACGWMADIYEASKTHPAKVEPTKFGDSDLKWPASLMELLFGGGSLDNIIDGFDIESAAPLGDFPGDLMDRLFAFEKPEDCTDCPAVNNCANTTVPVKLGEDNCGDAHCNDCDDTTCVE